jgi:hypothetical protein
VRFRLERWQIVTSLIALSAIAAAAIYFIRSRSGANSIDLVSFVPTANGTVVYIDVAAIRRAGILNMIAGSKAAEELEYRQFVDQTRFDYRQDLDAVAAVFKDGQVFLALRGRFHWKNLTDYALHQGGSCHNNYCVTPGSQPNRRVSFYPVKPDLMGLAVGPDDFAAYQITRQSGKLTLIPPNQPVWALVPAAALKESALLPAGAKSYISALQNGEQAVFTIGPDNDHLKLGVDVTCHDAAAAAALLANLENTTATLRKWIAREHQQANPADLSGVLVGGTFRRQDRQVEGQWPIPQAFVKAITGGSL